MVRPARRAHRGQPRSVSATRSRAESQHQLHHVSRRLHAQRSGVLQLQAQRQPTASVTPTALRPTSVGIAATKVRRTIRPSRRYVSGRSRICSTLLFISQGTPMLSMGDEVRRTQRGNNNAYCQDNEFSWFDWRDVERTGDMLRFVRELIRSRRAAIISARIFWIGALQHNSPILTWHGIHLSQPDWSDDSHSLAFSLHDPLGRRSACTSSAMPTGSRSFSICRRCRSINAGIG